MNRLARYALLPLAPLLIAAQNPGEIEIEPVPPPEELRSEAFVAAQYAQISSAAAAVDKVTARFSAGDNALAQLEQQRDEKLAELQAIDRQFTALIERGDQVSEEQRRELAERRRSVREEVTAIEDRINTDFPQYFELTRPKPLAIAQGQLTLSFFQFHHAHVHRLEIFHVRFPARHAVVLLSARGHLVRLRNRMSQVLAVEAQLKQCALAALGHGVMECHLVATIHAHFHLPRKIVVEPSPVCKI